MNKRIVLAIIVAAAVLIPIGCTPQPKEITIIGTPPSDSFVRWVEENIPLQSPSGRVTWSGKLTFDPTIDSNGKAEIALRRGWNLTFSRAKVRRVLLSPDIPEDVTKVVIKREVLVNYVIVDWWLDNQGYISVDDPELTSFFDGMGYHAVANEVQTYFEYSDLLVLWDGYTTPTCEQLLAVQELYKIGLVEGCGIQNLLSREECQ